jgi:hypothetical protein
LIEGEERDPTKPKISEIIKSHSVTNGESSDQANTPIFSPHDLVGRTFLKDEEEDGQKHRVSIISLIKDHEKNVAENPTLIKFLCRRTDGDLAEEIIT